MNRHHSLHQFSRTSIWRQQWRKVRYSSGWYVATQLLSESKRVFDFGLTLVLSLALVPVWVGLGVMGYAGWLEIRKTIRAGRYCEPFAAYSLHFQNPRLDRFASLIGLTELPKLLNILKGDMSLIGPRAVEPQEINPREQKARRRFDVRPGLICLWWIRQRANIDFGTEAEADSEYVETQSLKGDLGIVARSLPSLMYGAGGAPAHLDQVTMLGIPLDNVTMSQAIETLMDWVTQPVQRQVTYINPHCANIACTDPHYLRSILASDFILADGIGMKIAGKLLARPIRQNVNGTDLFPRLCNELQGTGHGIFLLGGKPGVADEVKQWIATQYPGVVVSGTHHGYFSAAEEPQILETIRQSGADLLLVAFGVPKQDVWIHQHLPQTGVKVGMGVGGLFDFYSGRIPRAPIWMREMGLEWLYRLLQEPGRMWKRYIVGNFVFLFRVIRERLSGKYI